MTPTVMVSPVISCDLPSDFVPLLSEWVMVLPFTVRVKQEKTGVTYVAAHVNAESVWWRHGVALGNTSPHLSPASWD